MSGEGRCVALEERYALGVSFVFHDERDNV